MVKVAAQKLVLNGTEITVKATKGRCMRLKIDGKTAAVSLAVPAGVSRAKAEEFVLSKYEWLVKSRSAVLSRIEGERLPQGRALLLGNECTVVHVPKGESFLRNGVIYLKVNSGGEAAALKGFYRKQLVEYVSERIGYYEALTGLKSTAVAVRDMTSRWGSCNCATGKITFSLNLAKKPPALIDYVILHELAHLRFPNHGKGFKDFLTLCMPDWKKRKKQLNGV